MGGLGLGIDHMSVQDPLSEDEHAEESEFSTQRWKSMLVCTGANACGKVSRDELPGCRMASTLSQSIYLKQVRYLINYALC